MENRKGYTAQRFWVYLLHKRGTRYNNLGYKVLPAFSFIALSLFKLGKTISTQCLCYPNVQLLKVSNRPLTWLARYCCFQIPFFFINCPSDGRLG